MNPLKSLTTYLRASRAELEKVTWPSREETIRYSILVTAVSVATAVFFASLDFGFRNGLDVLVTSVRPSITQQAAPAHDGSVTPDTEPFAPAENGGIEAVDEFGNPAEVDIESLPIDAIPDNSFTITPEEASGETE